MDAWAYAKRRLAGTEKKLNGMPNDQLLLAFTFREGRYVEDGGEACFQTQKNVLIERELAKRGESVRYLLEKHVHDARVIYSTYTLCSLGVVCEGLLNRLELLKADADLAETWTYMLSPVMDTLIRIRNQEHRIEEPIGKK